MLNGRSCLLTPNRLQPHLPLFVFLPGMDGTGQLLRTQTSGLESSFDVRCLAIPPTDLTSWEMLTEQVITLIKDELQRSPKRPVYLCGESFGGCLAIKVALYSPSLFERIILVNPASSFRRRPWLGLGAPITNLLPEPFYRLSAVGLLPWLANLHRIAPSDRQTLLEAMNSVPKQTSVWRLSLLNEFDVANADLKNLTQPVLFLASAADPLLPSVSEAFRLADHMPDAHVVVLPNSGHTCLLEADINLHEIIQNNQFLPQANLNSMPPH